MIALTGEDTEDLEVLRYDWSFWRTDVDTENPIAFGYTTPYKTADRA